MLAKRKWCYIQQPIVYDIAPCKCGNNKTQWSEFEEHLWCDKCNIDFIPEHYGIFDGPIPIGAARLLGIRFDRINLETQEVDRFDVVDLMYESEK